MSKYGILAVSTVVLCCIYWCESKTVGNEIRFEPLEFWTENSKMEKVETTTSKETLYHVNSKIHLLEKKNRKNSKKRKSRNFRRIDNNSNILIEEHLKPVAKQGRRHDFRLNRPHYKRYRSSLRSTNKTIISFNTITPYNIAAQLQEMEKLFPLENITQEIIGRTAEYNDIVLLKVQYLKNTNGSRYFRARNDNVFEDAALDKKIIFVVNGLSVMGIHSLPCLTEPHELARLLDSFFVFSHIFDIFVIPMANPDGMVSKQTKIWNKNVSPQKDCPGVALDRNFDVAWNGCKKGSSCSQQYPGQYPFSEPETRAIRDVFHRYGHKIVGYFHIHAGTYGSDVFRGDAVLYPKGYTDVQSDDDKYVDLKGEIDEAMRNASFRYLSAAVQPLHSWYGPVSGTSVDYASTVYGIPFAMELAMQLYDNNDLTNANWTEKEIALTDLWQPIINVIMDKIYDDLGVKGEV